MTLVSTKNHAQPIFSDSTPPEEATTVRPSKVIEESSAYCVAVAVKAGEHRLEMYVISAVPAIPPVIFSAVTQRARYPMR